MAPKSYGKLQYLFQKLFEEYRESDDVPERNAKSIINEILWSVANEKYLIIEDGYELEEYKDEHLSYIDAKTNFNSLKMIRCH